MVIIACRGNLERDVIGQFSRRNDNPGRMGRRMTRHAFDTAGKVHELGNAGIVLDELLEIPASFKGTFKGCPRCIGDEFIDLPDNVQGHFHQTAHILDCRLGRQGPKGDNLGHVAFSVFTGQIVHHQMAFHITDIRINIRHAHAFRIKKTFKDEVIFQGIDVRNACKVRNNASGGTATARTNGYIMGPAVIDEVPDNEEVT